MDQAGRKHERAAPCQKPPPPHFPRFRNGCRERTRKTRSTAGIGNSLLAFAWCVGATQLGGGRAQNLNLGHDLCHMSSLLPNT
jgi:hypothetical protein